MTTQTAYTYDKRNRIKTVKQGEAVTAEYDYDGVGNIISLKNSNGINVTAYTYDKLNQIKTITYPNGKSEVYTYDNSGNLISKIDRKGNEASYNYAGMLTNETETLNGVQSTRSYTYDKAGNRKTLIATGGEVYQTTYNYDKNNRLTSDVTVKSGETEVMNYRYDNNGNQILKYNGISKVSTADGLKLGVTTITGNKNDKMVYQTFKYDGFNQLIGTQMNGSKCNSVEYTYRPDGLRLSKNVDNNTNRSYYVWSGDNLQAELNASGQIKSYNV